MYVCMYVSYVYVHIYIYINVYMHACVLKGMCTYADIHTSRGLFQEKAKFYNTFFHVHISKYAHVYTYTYTSHQKRVGFYCHSHNN